MPDEKQIGARALNDLIAPLKHYDHALSLDFRRRCEQWWNGSARVFCTTWVS